MHVLMVDRWRNVRIAPTKMLDDPFDTLRSLIPAAQAGRANRQSVFECDKAFFDACGAADADHDPKLLVLGEWHEGGNDVPTFSGIPLISTGA